MASAKEMLNRLKSVSKITTLREMVYDEILGMEAIEGKLFIDMSTISEQLSVRIAQKLKQKNVSFLDAPVAGSTQPAASGTLTIMVGGDANDLALDLP